MIADFLHILHLICQLLMKVNIKLKQTGDGYKSVGGSRHACDVFADCGRSGNYDGGGTRFNLDPQHLRVRVSGGGNGRQQRRRQRGQRQRGRHYSPRDAATRQRPADGAVVAGVEGSVGVFVAVQTLAAHVQPALAVFALNDHVVGVVGILADGANAQRMARRATRVVRLPAAVHSGGRDPAYLAKHAPTRRGVV